MRKSRNKNKEQLGLLTQDDILDLPKAKQRFKLKKAGSPSRSGYSDLLFDNLITTEELAVIFRVSPQTIRNWVARRKIPHIQIGRRNLFQVGRLQQWLNRKEEPLWE